MAAAPPPLPRLLLLAAGLAAGAAEPPFGQFSGFESGDVLSTLDGRIWKPCGAQYERFVCGHIQAQEAVVRSGRYAANVSVQPGDILNEHNTERAELDSGKFTTLGMDVWYGWSLNLPHDFEQTHTRLIIGQWKQGGKATGGISPPLAMRYRRGEWYLSQRLETYERNGTLPNGANETKFPLPAFPLGTWADLVFHIRFAKDESGAFSMWINGTRHVNFSGRTAYREPGAGDAFYNKIGLYRDAVPTSWHAFIDNYEIGRSYADIDPATFDTRHPGGGR